MSGGKFYPCVNPGLHNIPGMRMLLLLSLALGAVAAAIAETKPKFQLGAISKGRTMPSSIRVNGQYPPAKATIEFSVTPTQDIPMKELVNFIYFFNDQNQLVQQRSAALDLARMNFDMTKTLQKMEDLSRKTKSGSFSVPVDLPETAQAGKKYHYQHVIQEKDPKWTHVVVVAGRRDADLSARVYPKTDLKSLNFADKSKITYWYQP